MPLGILGWLGRSALLQSPIGAVLKAVPRWVWIALAIAAALMAARVWHQHQVHKFESATRLDQKTSDDRAWNARLAQEHINALGWKKLAEDRAKTISSQLKEIHDAQVRSNASDADDLRVRGPGKAAAADCGPGNHPGLPAAAGGSGGADRNAHATASPVPAADGLAGLPTGARSSFAVVPWSWLVDQAEQSDDSRAEVIAWRNWYVKQADASQPAKAPAK